MSGKMGVRFQVSGLSLEKLLNAAQKQGIVFKRVKREKNRSLTVVSSLRAYRAFRQLAQEKGYQVSPAKPLGLLRLGDRLLRRMGLLAGALLGTALLIWALGYVWAVRVENAGPYAGEVRLYLQEAGIGPGVRRSAVHLDALREGLEWRLPQVKWVRTEWAGVVLRVRLEQGVPPPDVGEEAPGDLVAGEDGLLLRLTTFAGTPAASAGDFVRAGQVLIRGEERGADGRLIPVAARGEAIARLWVSAQAKAEMLETASHPTGRETELRLVAAPFGEWSGTEEPDYLTWDRERTVLPLGGAWAPLWLIRETRKEVFLSREPRSLEEVKREGAQKAIFALNQALVGQEVVDKWINFSMIERDTITVTATAEIRRDIGRRKGP